MHVSAADIAAAKRLLFAPPRVRPEGAIDFKVRPISEEWRLVDKMPAYRTATCNVAYIWRDADVADRFGPMPWSFAERRCELRASGLLLPGSAPLWATDRYNVWEDADAHTAATGDPTEVSAWHVLAEIPAHIAPRNWAWLTRGFFQRMLADRGAAVAYAVHALEGEGGSWIVPSHAHAIVTARSWRRNSDQGRRHPAWISSWGAQKRLEGAWRRRCAATNLSLM
jgi:hypothetical protein